MINSGFLLFRIKVSVLEPKWSGKKGSGILVSIFKTYSGIILFRKLEKFSEWIPKTRNFQNVSWKLENSRKIFQNKFRKPEISRMCQGNWKNSRKIFLNVSWKQEKMSKNFKIFSFFHDFSDLVFSKKGILAHMYRYIHLLLSKYNMCKYN